MLRVAWRYYYPRNSGHPPFLVLYKLLCVSCISCHLPRRVASKLIGASPLTIIQKMNTNPSSNLSPNMQPTSSLGRRYPIQELLISRDSSRFHDAIISSMFGISAALGRISNQQEVLLNKIELIAQKQEILQKEVQSLKKAVKEIPATQLRGNSPLPFPEEIQAWLDLPLPSPPHGTTADLRCSETLNSWYNQLNGPTSPANGTMGLPAPGNPEGPIQNCQRPT